MRNFSKEEKDFIKKLLNIANSSNNVLIGNIVYDELADIEIYLDYQNEQVQYRFDANLYNQNPINFIDFARNFSWKIIRYFKLLKYLESNNMLFLYQEDPDVNNSKFGGLIQSHQYITSGINDIEAIYLILEFSKKTIVINQSIRDYIKNDYKTDDDIKHNQNIELAKKNLEVANKSNELAQKSLKKVNATIYVTIALFILGAILNFYIASKK